MTNIYKLGKPKDQIIQTHHTSVYTKTCTTTLVMHRFWVTEAAYKRRITVDFISYALVCSY